MGDSSGGHGRASAPEDQRVGPARAQFQILFVCTGNQCRSPVAQLVGRRLLEQRLGKRAACFDLRSVGVKAVPGGGLHPFTRRRLTSRGIPPEELAAFAARQLDERAVAEANLVLTMTARHRSVILDEVPQALAKTFVLRELARFGPGLDLASLPCNPVERARMIVARGGMARAQFPAHDLMDDDIEDPVLRPVWVQRQVAGAVETAVSAIFDMVVGEARPTIHA